MGRTRQRQQTQQSSAPEASAEATIALAIAALLMGHTPPEGGSIVAAIAARLAQLPGLPESDEDGTVASSVARLVVVDRPKLVERPAPLATRRASTQNLSCRAHYAIEAVKRVAQNVADGEGVRAALEGERSHFSRHLDASRDRISGARLNDAAAERFGSVLSWNHTAKSATHRPSHVAANGANYRIDSRPAATDGMLPGMAPHCDCVPAPPIEGARLLI